MEITCSLNKVSALYHRRGDCGRGMMESGYTVEGVSALEKTLGDLGDLT